MIKTYKSNINFLNTYIETSILHVYNFVRVITILCVVRLFAFLSRRSIYRLLFNFSLFRLRNTFQFFPYLFFFNRCLSLSAALCRSCLFLSIFCGFVSILSFFFELFSLLFFLYLFFIISMTNINENQSVNLLKKRTKEEQYIILMYVSRIRMSFFCLANIDQKTINLIYIGLARLVPFCYRIVIT